MVDIGATHNFICKGKARKLDLKLEKDPGYMKVVNSKAFTTIRVVKQVLVKLDSWQGRIKFIIAWIDNFDAVLGMEFLLAYHIILVPIASCLMNIGEDPCVLLIQTKQPEKTRLTSALQFKIGMKW